jgi:hypothetical protein
MIGRITRIPLYSCLTEDALLRVVCQGTLTNVGTAGVPTYIPLQTSLKRPRVAAHEDVRRAQNNTPLNPLSRGDFGTVVQQ